jgi:peptidyl-tRNA hydrolase
MVLSRLVSSNHGSTRYPYQEHKEDQMKTLNLPEADDGVLAIDQINERDYRNAHGLNKSLLVEFMKSPRHYLEALNAKKKPTDNMDMGTALHATLFRDAPADHFAVMTKKLDKRKPADKEFAAQFEAENAGKVILSVEQDETVKAMHRALMDNGRFKELYEKTTYRELGIFADYKHEDQNFRIKGMLDGYAKSEGIIYDVKSSQDAHIDSFKWDFKRFRYDLQQVHYTRLLGQTNLPFTQFVFVVVENKAPYGVAFYTLGMESYMKTHEEWKSWLEYYGKLNHKQDFNIGYPSSTFELNY